MLATKQAPRIVVEFHSHLNNENQQHIFKRKKKDVKGNRKKIDLLN